MKKIYSLFIIANLFGLNIFAQTALLKEINPTGAGGANGAQAGEVTKVSDLNLLFFRANNNVPGSNFELWKSDGTAAGTQMVRDINPNSGFPSNLTDIAGTLVYSANDGTTGTELWRSNGTSAGTQRISDINPGAAGSDPENFVRNGATQEFLFFATTAANGKELFKTNLSNNTTTLVRDINTTPGVGSNPSNLVYANGVFYFAANDGVNGNELWRSDGTQGGTFMLKNINASGSSFPNHLYVFNNEVFFAANNGADGVELWKTDGTSGGTNILRNINTTAGVGSNPSKFMEVNGTLYFTADNGINGVELYKTDGSGPGVSIIEVNSGPASSNPNNFVAIGTQLYFSATNATVGNELYRYDGTNLALVANIDGAATSSSPQNLTNAYGLLYFTAETSAHGRELYVSNGTAAGTQRISDINTGPTSSNPIGLGVINNKLLFFADSAAIGQELFEYVLPNTPVLSPIANQTMNENSTLGPVNFSINSTAGISTLSLSAISLDLTKVPNSGITFDTLAGGVFAFNITPNNFQRGPVDIIIRVCDNSNNCVSDTFTLTILSVPNLPILTSFTIDLLEDNTYNFTSQDWLDEYFDGDGDQLDSLRILSLPANGKMFLGNIEITNTPRRIQRSRLGEISFKPDTNFFGINTIQWDAKGGGDWSSNQATCTLNVIGVNDAPVFTDRVRVTTDEDVPYTFQIADFEGVYSDVENDLLTTVRIVGLPRIGKLVFGPDTLRGSMLPFNIPRNGITNLVYYSPLNYFGMDTFRLRMSDGMDFSLQDTAYITINPVNDPPIGGNISLVTDEDVAIQLSPATFDSVYSDVENVALQAVRITNIGNNITVKLGANNVAVNQIIPRNQLASLQIVPDQYWFGNTTVEYRPQDDSLFSVVDYTIFIQVNPVNNPPIAANVTFNGLEDVNISLDIQSFRNAFSNPFFGEPDTFSGIQIVNLPANASLLNSGNPITSAQLPVNLNNNQIENIVFAPDQDWNGTTSFQYNTFDGFDYSSTPANVIFNLTPVNDPPVVFGFTLDLFENGSVSFIAKDFTDNFLDVDGDTLVNIRITQLPTNGVISVNNIPINTPNTNVAKSALSTMVYTPTQFYNGLDSIKYVAFDPAPSMSNEATVLFDIEPVNNPPQADSFAVSGLEDQIINFFEDQFVNNFFDVDGDPLSNIRFTQLPSVAEGQLRLSGAPVGLNNLILKSNINNLTFTPAANFNGQVVLKYQSRDAEFFSNTADIFVDVIAVNDAPTVSGPNLISAVQDQNANIVGIGFDDVDAGNIAVTVSLDVQEGHLTLNTTTGLVFSVGTGIQDSNMVFTGTLANVNSAMTSLVYRGDLGFSGFDRIRAEINDNGNTGLGGPLTAVREFPIDVAGVNDAPLFLVPDTISTFEDTEVTVNGISVDDADNFNNNYEVVINAPNGRVSLSGTAGLVFKSGTGTNNKSMRFFGQLNFVNSALNNLRYTSDVGFVGVELVALTVIDSVSQSLSIQTDNEILYVDVQPRPVTFIQQPQNRQVCEELGTSMTVLAEGTPPFQYQWFKNNLPVVGAQTNTLELSDLDLQDADNYYCEVTNPAGPFNSSNGVLTVFEKPQADFGNTQACVGQSVAFTNQTTLNSASITQFAWDMGEGSVFTIANPTHTFISSNSFNVRMAVTSSQGCRDTIIKPIQVVSSPVANFIAPDVCDGESMSFTNTSSVAVGSLTYLWDFGMGSSTDQNPSFQFATPGAKNISLTAINNGVCSVTTTQQKVVFAKPVPNFSSPDVCRGRNLNFTNTSTISSGTMSFLWNFGDGNSTNNVSPVHVFSGVNSYNVNLIATSNNGCQDSITKPVVVYPVPAVGFNFSDICESDSVAFQNTTTTTQGGLSFDWAFGDGTMASNSNPIKSYNSIGAYQVRLLATGVFGCSDSIVRTINVNPDPNVDFSFSNECRGTAIEFTNLTTVAQGVNAFNWSFGDGTTSANTSPIKNYAAAGDYFVNLTATTDKACTKSLTKRARVYPQPIANFTRNNVCEVDSVLFTNTSQVSGGGFISNWSFDDGNTTTRNDNFYYQYANFGTYDVSLIVVADSGCVDSVTKTVNVFASPVASFTANDVCLGETIDFINTSSIAAGIITHQWRFDDGTTTQNQNPIKTYNFVDTFNVRLLVTSSNACQDSAFLPVVVKPFPIVAIGAANVCDGDSVQFFNTTSATTGNINYLWSLGDGSANNSQEFKHLYTSPGSYNVKMIATADGGCQDSITLNLAVNPVATIGITSADVSCNATPTGQINVTASGGTPPYQYSVSGGGTYQGSPLFTGLSAGAFTVQTLDANGCLAVFANNPYNINQPPNLTAAVANANDISCFGGNNGSINVSAGGGTPPYSFNINNSGFQGTGQFNNLTAGFYTIRIVDGNGCDLTVDSTLSQPNTAITAALNFTNLLCRGDSSGTIQVSASGSVGGYEYSIDNGNTFQQSSTFNGLAAGSFTVLVRDSNLCQTSQGVSLSEPATAVNVSLIQLTDVTCFGENSGRASFSGIGGTGAKQYALNAPTNFQLSNSFANLSAGSYQVYATDFNGCLDSLSFNILQPATRVEIDTVLIQNVNCFGENTGSFTISASGGVPAYRFSVDQGNNLTTNNVISNLSANTYQILVIDGNNCSVIDSFSILQPSLLTLSTTNIQNESCELDGSGAFTLAASGGTTPYEYSANGSAFQSNATIANLISGAYEITVRDNNSCLSVINEVISADNLLPVANFAFQLAGNAAAFINLSSDAESYQWNFGDGNTSILESPTHLYGSAAIYEVMLAVENLCGADTNKQFVNLNASAIHNVSNETKLTVYPNPSQGRIVIETNNNLKEITSIEVFDMSGRLVHNIESVLSNSIQVDLGHLSQGVYQLRTRMESELIINQLIIK